MGFHFLSLGTHADDNRNTAISVFFDDQPYLTWRELLPLGIRNGGSPHRCGPYIIVILGRRKTRGKKEVEEDNAEEERKRRGIEVEKRSKGGRESA